MAVDNCVVVAVRRCAASVCFTHIGVCSVEHGQKGLAVVGHAVPRDIR